MEIFENFEKYRNIIKAVEKVKKYWKIETDENVKQTLADWYY